MQCFAVLTEDAGDPQAEAPVLMLGALAVAAWRQRIGDEPQRSKVPEERLVAELEANHQFVRVQRRQPDQQPAEAAAHVGKAHHGGLRLCSIAVAGEPFRVQSCPADAGVVALVLC